MLARYELRLPDIKHNPDGSLEEFDGEFKLPMDEFIDYKKMGMKPVPAPVSLIKTEQSCLVFFVQDMTRLESMLVQNPNREIIEDRRQKDSFSIKDVS